MTLQTTRILKNHACTSTASTYPRFVVGEPLPPCSSAYPATNLLTRDRNLKAQLVDQTSFLPTGTAGDVLLPIDLGGSKSINVVGFTGAQHSLVNPLRVSLTTKNTHPDPVVTSCTVSSGGVVTRAGGTFPVSIKVGMRVSGTGIAAGTVVLAAVPNSSNNAYVQLQLSLPPITPGTVTLTFTDSSIVIPYGNDAGFVTYSGDGNADAFVELAAPVVARYAFLTLQSVILPFAFGSALIASIETDLGFAYSSGSQETLVLSRSNNRTASRTLITNKLGPDKVALSYQFNNVGASVRSALERAVSSTPFLLMTAAGKLYEVDVPDGALTSQVVWGSPELYNITLAMESLP